MIKIAFTGDIMLARSIGEKLKKPQHSNILSDTVVNFLKGFDFVVGNLECPVSKDAMKIRSTGFKAHPESLHQIQSFDLFSLANNHVFDCDKKGATDTLDNLNRLNKKHTGLLNNDEETFFVKTKITNKTFAFFSCAVKPCIKDSQPDCYPKVIKAESQIVLEKIKEAKSTCDYIIMLVHGGNEMIPYPEPKFRSLCQSYIDSGADTVITHHPHVLGGVHHYNNKFIFYSLGDFIFDGESYLRRKGMILALNFNEDKVTYDFKATQINSNLMVTFADLDKKHEIEKKWNRISSVLKLDQDYNTKYKLRYIKSLIYFQLDRFYFLLKNKGFLYLVNFIFKKLSLLPFYLKKIISKNHE